VLAAYLLHDVSCLTYSLILKMAANTSFRNVGSLAPYIAELLIATAVRTSTYAASGLLAGKLR
jgi:hypothetical protein